MMAKMYVDDAFNDLFPTHNNKIELWQSQKNLICTALFFEHRYNLSLSIEKQINELLIKYFEFININNAYNDIMNDFKFDIFDKKKILCFQDKVGQGKSYVALFMTYKKYDFFDEKINIIIVPYKLIKQWQTYINTIEINNYYVINTTKSLNNYIFIKNEDLILLISENFVIQFYNTFLNFENKYKILRCFVDEYDFIKNQNCIRNIFNVTRFNYVISSTLTCDGKFLALVNKENFVNKHTYPINYIRLSITTLLHLIQKLSVTDEEILKNYNISNYDTSSELFKYIFRHKQEKINELKSDLCEYLQTFLNKKNISKYNVMLQDENYSHIFTIYDELKNETSIDSTLYDQIQQELNNKNIVDRILLDECNICLAEIEEKTILLCCFNVTCCECIKKLKQCPYCRTILYTIPISKKLESKIDKLCELRFSMNSKIVILGNDYEIKNENLQKLSMKWFDNKNILILKGNSNTCNSIITKFKYSDNKNILYFPDLKSVCGLNLEFATDLILIGTIQENKKQQIIGRVQRFGRKSSLNLYYFDEI